MISLYIIFLVSSFIAGCWDKENIGVFVLAVIMFPLVLDEIKERRKVKKWK